MARQLSNCWETRPDKAGGAKGDRTPDLGIANAALSQLSYRPGQPKLYNVQGEMGTPTSEFSRI